MEEIILFLLSFIFVFLLYQLFIIPRAKKKKEKRPIEVSYLVYKYHMDLDKVKYNHILQVIAVVSSFDIALIVSVIMNISNFFLEVFVGFGITFIIILSSYHVVYLFYKKKGMIKNES